MARPHVLAKIAELRARAEHESLMSMVERRKLLGETARKAKGTPTHGDRIAAIREDAILAGERRTDGSQVNLTLEVNVGSIVGALRGADSAIPVEAIPCDSTALEAPPATLTLPEQQNAPSALPAAQNGHGSVARGPLGMLMGHNGTNGHSNGNGKNGHGNGHARGMVVEE